MCTEKWFTSPEVTIATVRYICATRFDGHNSRCSILKLMKCSLCRLKIYKKIFKKRFTHLSCFLNVLKQSESRNYISFMGMLKNFDTRSLIHARYILSRALAKSVFSPYVTLSRQRAVNTLYPIILHWREGRMRGGLRREGRGRGCEKRFRSHFPACPRETTCPKTQ